MRQVITNVEQPYEYEETYKTNRRKNIRRPNMRRAVTTVNNSLQRHSHSFHCFLKENVLYICCAVKDQMTAPFDIIQNDKI